MASVFSVVVNIGARIGASLDAAQRRLDRLGRGIQGQRAAYRAQIGDAVALGASLYGLLNPAIEFESAMADVNKVVDFKDPVAGLKAMENQIKSMARDIPLTHEGLLQIAASGGRMGIAEDKLAQYTEMVAKMSAAWEMAPDAAGEAMGKISNVLGLTMDQTAKLGDAINKLDDSSTAKAAEIAGFMKRTSGTGKQFGLKPQELAALGTAMIDLGATEEIAATGTNALLTRLQSAPIQTAKFQAALKKLGWSAKGMQKAIGRDAQGTLTEFLGTLTELSDTQRANVLGEMFGAEYGDDIARLVGGMDKYRQHLALVSKEENYLGSVQKEFEVRTKTTKNQLVVFNNRIREVGIIIGATVLPALNRLLAKVGPVLTQAGEWIERNDKLVGTLATVGVGLIGFKIATIGVGYAWTFLAGGVLAGSRALLGAGRILLTLLNPLALVRGAFVALRVAMLATPVGAVVAGLAIAGAWVYNNWHNVTIAFDAFASSFMRAIEPVLPILQPVTDKIGVLWDRLAALVAPIEGAESAFLQFGGNLGRMVGEAVVWLVDLPDTVDTALTSAATAFVDWTNRADAAVQALPGRIGEGLRTAGAMLGQVMLGLAGQMLDAFLSIEWVNAGVRLVGMIVEGIKSAASSLADAVRGALNDVRQYLPFSDAKIGPMSNLTDSGRAVVTTLGEGVKNAGSSPIAAPLSRAMDGAMVGAGIQAAAANNNSPTANDNLEPAGGRGAAGRRLRDAVERSPAPAEAPAPAGAMSQPQSAAPLAGVIPAPAAAPAGAAAAPATVITNTITVNLTVSPNIEAESFRRGVEEVLERVVGDMEHRQRSALYH